MNKKKISKVHLLSLFLLASCTTPTTFPVGSSNPLPTMSPSANTSVNPDASQSSDTQPSSSVNPSDSISPTPSATVSSPTSTSTTLTIPSDFLKLSYNDYYSAALKWSQINGAKSYKIYQDGKLVADNLTGVNYNVTNLIPNTNYSFDIVAVNETSQSNKSTIKVRTFIPSSSSSNNNYSNNSSNYSTPYVDTNPVIYYLSASRGLNGDEITINGANFSSSVPLNIVKFGNTVASVISASSTQLKVIVPSGLGSQPVNVTVGSIRTNALPFTIIGISSVSENTRKVSEKLTVYGAGFTGVTSAKVGDTNATDLIIVSDTELNFTVPSTGTRGIQTITLSNGTQTFTNNDPATNDDLNILNRIVFVNASANGGNNGKSWIDAYNDLQMALGDNTVMTDDEIWVAQGTYKPGTNRTSTFTLKSGVKLYGGFTSGATNINSRNYINTILSGDIGNTGNNSDNVYHVITGIQGDTVNIDGFIIRDGNADSNTGNPLDRGAGIYNKANLTMMNCTVKFNTSDFDGGGLLNDGTVTIGGNSIFENNIAKSGGGGINNGADRSLTIGNNTIIRKNRAAQGGGIFNYLGTVNLNNSASVTDNSANLTFSGKRSGGGGIYNFSGTININNANSVTDNSTYTEGGGIYNYSEFNTYGKYGSILGDLSNIKDNSPDNQKDVYF